MANQELPRVSASSKPATQARLILQDPMAFDQASQPVLRSSIELTEQLTPGLDREKARELWENLSMEPEGARERQAERKRLLARAEQLALEASAATTRAAALDQELSRAREERFNHPFVYAGAAALLGVSALWWLERRKRMQLQELDLEFQANQSPSLSDGESRSAPHDSKMLIDFEDSLDLAQEFATDLPGLPERPTPSPSTSLRKATDTKFANDEDEVAPESAIRDTASKKLTEMPQWARQDGSLPTEEELVAMSRRATESSLMARSKRAFKRLFGIPAPVDALAPSHLPTEIQSSAGRPTGSPSTVLHSQREHSTTQLLYDEGTPLVFEQTGDELLAWQGNNQTGPDLLSQTRVTPLQGETAMEHLLELRTAVNGLCALGRADGASRLLREHIAAEPSTCAWAYLEYMQLCESLDQRDEFELTRKGYRQQFNRMAPYWHEPNGNVLGLDGYARAAGELCTVWAQGTDSAQSALASWLVGPLLGRKLLQLPAYHDLLDLYEMLEFFDQCNGVVQSQGSQAVPTSSPRASAVALAQDVRDPIAMVEQEFVPTVSLLDLDYEFSSDVTLEESEVAQSEKAVTVVKSGSFSVDFNTAGTQIGGLFSSLAELDKK